jgi:hypothetical protein
MNLQENINRIKEMMGVITEGESQKDLSSLIKQSLEPMMERESDIICDIKVTGSYKVKILIKGGPNSKYWPVTQAVRKKYDEIIDEVWGTIYSYFGQAVDVNLEMIDNCSNKINESDPKVGTGKKPKGSDRRLYTDENPSDTVSVKFRTKQDIIDTLNKESFKSKSHARQSQIINLIHQRLRVALERAKDPEVKKRLRTAFEYIESKKEESKRKTQEMKEGELTERCWKGYTQKGMKTMFGKRYPNCVKIKK